MGNGDAHARFDIAKGGSAWMPPFFTEELSNPFEGVDCFGAEHAINGHNKRNKIAMVFVAFLLAFFLFGVFRSNQTFLWIFVDVGLSIQVLKPDVEDGIPAVAEESTN